MIIQSEKIVNNPKLSVVIATYNQVNYIEQTVMSVLGQHTTFPFEVIVADDGSNDGERDLLIDIQKKYPEILRLIFNDKNLMVTLNYVNAIHEANGEFIATLDGDDYYLTKYALQKLVDYLDNHLDVSLVHGGFRMFQSDTGKILAEYDFWESPMLNTNGIKSAYCVLTDNYSRYPLGSSSCFRKSIYIEGCEKYAGIIESTINFGEGTILNVVMAMAGKYGFIKEIISAYRVLPNSLSHFSTNKENFEFCCKYTYAKFKTAEEIGIDETLFEQLVIVLLKKLELNALRFNQLDNFYSFLNKIELTNFYAYSRNAIARYNNPFVKYVLNIRLVLLSLPYQWIKKIKVLKSLK